MWQAFLWSSSVWTTVKTQRDKIASWSARMVANVIGVKRPPWMELNQRWRLWHTTGHRWIEKGNMNVLTAIRECMLSWAGGPERNLCEGLEMPRPPMVEMERTPLERSGERQMVWPTPTAIQNLPVGGHGCWGSVQIHWTCRRFVGVCPGQHGLVASCSKPWKLETVFDMWKEPCIDGPGCLGDPCASSMTGTDAGAAWLTRRRNVRERFGVHLVHLYLYQANRDIASVSSWYRAGYGWPDSYGRGYGRRGCWSGIPEDVWFCETCRMVLWRSGAKVLSWNVSGDVFLSQTSMIKTGVLKLGMTDFFHVGELIPRPKTMDGMNEPMRARALHTMVTNTWMNANTGQEFCTVLESQFCKALRGNNGMTARQKLLEIEEMHCRRAGVVQTTSWAQMAVVASMASMAPLASMVVASMASMALMALELKSERESAVVW